MLEERELRQELFKISPYRLKREEVLSFLAAFLITGGELALGGGGKVTLNFRHSDTVLFATACLDALYGYRPEIGLTQTTEKKKVGHLTLELPAAISKKLLVDCRMLKVDENGKETYTLGLGSMRWVKSNRYLCALTMEYGRLYTSDDYRLDLSLTMGGKRQKEVEAMMARYEVRYGTAATEDKLRLSIRREAVAEYLALIGASQCSLVVTEFYFERNVNRSVTRAVNCSTNNMDKAYRAATNQLWAIAILKEKGEYSNLRREVRAVGDARSQLPEAPLQQIADGLGINKTAVYRRMKVITDAAEKYRGE